MSLLLGGDLIDDLAIFGTVFGTVEAVIEGSEFDVRFDPRLHFGLGAAATAEIEIHWPRGASETHGAAAADQLVTIREGEGIVTGRPFR